MLALLADFGALTIDPMAIVEITNSLIRGWFEKEVNSCPKKEWPTSSRESRTHCFRFYQLDVTVCPCFNSRSGRGVGGNWPFLKIYTLTTLYTNLYITIYPCFTEHFRFMSLGSTTEIDEGAAMPPGRLTGGAQKTWVLLVLFRRDCLGIPGEVVGYPTVTCRWTRWTAPLSHGPQAWRNFPLVCRSREITWKLL